MKSKIVKLLLSLILLLTILLGYYLWKPSHFEGQSRSGIKVECERGVLQVPANHKDPNSKKISVGYVRMKSFSQNPKSPIFYLEGGPGGTATDQSTNPHALENWVKYLKHRDVILIDQRGAGKWKLIWLNFCGPNKDVFVSADIAQQYFNEIATKALRSFDRRGIDLNAYNSIASAHDVDKIREHLGYDKIIPLGFSYGTHLGLTYIRYFENRIEKAVLAGVEGPDHTFKLPLDLDRCFEALSARVAADSLLGLTIPDLLQLYDRVSKKLSQEPVSLSIKNPIGLRRKINVGKYGLDYFIKRDLGDARDLRIFPKLLYDIDQGNYDLLTRFAQKRYRELYAIPAMMFSMDLASGASKGRLQQIVHEEKESRFGTISNAPFLQLLGKWPVEDLGEDFRKPLKSNIPVLFLSGDLDANTPAHQAKEIALGFPNSTSITVQDAGHEQILASWDAIDLINDFLLGKEVADSTAMYPHLPFVQLE